MFQRFTETSYIGLPQDTCLKKSGGKPVRAKHPPSYCLRTDHTQTNKMHIITLCGPHPGHRNRWTNLRPYSSRSIGPEDWRHRVPLGLNALHLSPLWKATAVKAAVKMQSPGPRWAAAALHGVELNWSSFTLTFYGKKFSTTPTPKKTWAFV